MDMQFTTEEVRFREEARTWLSENAPSGKRPPAGPPMREYDLAWQKTMFDAGWAGINWPSEFGGRGSTVTESLIWFEEYARAGLAPMDARFVGESHAGPTLMARASEEQKRFHLPKILEGDVVWCQGFSEPDAGSDLASLRTRGEVDGDHLVVTGQKIWTSFADVADWQELLVRTDPDAPKHKGISWVICDMHTPGIDVRPIVTIDGHAEFAEVFYDEVRIPLENVVGGMNNGWKVAMSTLAFERGTAFTAYQIQLASTVERLIEIARVRKGPDGRTLIEDEELARNLGRARADVTSLQAMTYMGVSRNLQTGSPGAEGSMLKLHWSDLAKKVSHIALDMIGQDALSRAPVEGEDWVDEFLFSFSHSIGGGTSEIQRNIIAERVLGLPR